MGRLSSGWPRVRTLILFIGLSLLTRWLSLVVEILDIDETAHIVGSWVLRDGDRLYRDFVDNKPPGLYAYYALAQIPFGTGLVSVRLLTALLTVPLTAFAASSFYRHGRKGLVAGLLHLLYGSAFLAHDMLSASAELILLLPATWAVVCVADETRARRVSTLSAAGALLGVAALVQPQAAIWLPVLAWAALTGEARALWPRLGRLLAVFAGFLLPLILTGLAFLAAGTAQDLVYWTLQRNVGYALNPISAQEALVRAGRSLVPWLLAMAPLWWAWRFSRPLLTAREKSLLSLLLVLGFVPVFTGLRFFPHYFIPLGWALCVGAAPAVTAWLTRPLGRPGRVCVAATLVLVLGFQIGNAALYFGGRRIYRETDPVYREAAARLARDPCFTGSRLFVWGWAPAFYYYAGLSGARPASRFAVLAQAGLTDYVPGNIGRRAEPPGGQAARHWDWLLDDLERSRATYILDTAPAGIYRWDRYPLSSFPRLDAYISERYELLDRVDGVRVFRRLGCE